MYVFESQSYGKRKILHLLIMSQLAEMAGLSQAGAKSQEFHLGLFYALKEPNTWATEKELDQKWSSLDTNWHPSWDGTWGDIWHGSSINSIHYTRT